MLRFLRMISGRPSRLAKGPVHIVAGMLLLFALVAGGCYYEDTYYENAETDYTTISEHDLSGEYPLKTRLLQGKITFPSSANTGAFVPEKIRIIQLDSSLAPYDSATGTLNTGREISFKMPTRDYRFPYVKVRVKGKWKFLDSTAVPLTLEAVSDISNIAEPNVNLMTHLEVPLVEALVGEGYPFSVAKKLAMRRFIENFGFKQESLPAESVGRAYDETGSLLALFMRNYTDSSFVENIEDFRLDLADGVYEDSLALVEFADYVVKNWQNMRMRMYNLNPEWSGYKFSWRLIERFVENAYGLESCVTAGEKVSYVKNGKSKLDGDSLLCDKRGNGDFFHRPFAPEELLYGPCTAINTENFVSDGDSAFYVCKHKTQYDSTRVLSTWVKATWGEVLDNELGVCSNALIENEAPRGSTRLRKKFGDTIYVCVAYNRGWRNDGTDTLNFMLGNCTSGDIWKRKMLPDSSEFVCAFDSWTPVNDTLRFLSEQRPCDKATDSLRVVMYDSIYYICTDKRKKWNGIYTFEKTTKRVADSLAFIASMPPCKSLADTIKYIVDTTTNRYYHCEIRNTILKFYDSDYDHAEKYLNEQYLKTLPECTAESDTFELFVHPYFEKTRHKDWNTYFHCAFIDGKYQYEALGYGKRRDLEGLADVNARYTCDANTDTLSFVRDSLYGDYFHCEKHDGKYVFVEINERQADYYASLAGESNLEACSANPDTLEYRQDAYGYYFYCKENGGAYVLTRIQKDSLIEMLIEEFAKKVTDGCDDIEDLGKVGYEKIMGKDVDVICDYNADSVLAYQRVSYPHYNFFGKIEDKRNDPTRYVQWEKCSDEQLAARGTPVKEQGGYITDPRDGRRYRVTTIGKQVWMAENMNYYDTLAAPNMIGLTGCSDDVDSCEATGRLYYWHAAMNLVHGTKDEVVSQTCAPVQGICPAGWHIPSLEEWHELARYATYKNDGAFGVGLKAETGWWTRPNYDDMFGFSASPVTWTTDEAAYFVTSDASGSGSSVVIFYGINFYYSHDSPEIIRSTMKGRSYSVRCVKD